MTRFRTSIKIMLTVATVSAFVHSWQVVAQSSNELDQVQSVLAAREESRIRACQVSPDCPVVDIWLDGTTLILSDLGFQGLTSYSAISSGEHWLVVVPSGGQPDDGLLTLDNYVFEPTKDYTLALYDQVSSLSGVILPETSPTGADRFVLRVMHAAYTIDDIDILYIPLLGDPSELWSDLALGEAGEFQEFALTTHRLGIDATNDLDPEHTFPLPAIAGNVVVTGLLASASSGGLYLLLIDSNGTVTLVNPEPQLPRLRFIHTASEIGMIDVWLNQAVTLVTGLEFGTGTSTIIMDTGSYRLDLVPAGMTPAESLVTVESATFESEQLYTCSLYGAPANLGALLTIDEQNPAGEKALIRAIHAAPRFTELDAYLISSAGNQFLWRFVGIGTATSYTEIVPGTIDLGLDWDSDGVPDELFDLSGLTSATICSLFIVDDGEGIFLLLQKQDHTVTRIEPRPHRASIRVVNLRPDGGAIDLWLTPTIRIAQAIGFQSSSGYQKVDEGTYMLTVTEAGQSPEAGFLNLAGVDLESGSYTTVVVYGFDSDVDGMVLNDELSDVPSGKTRLRAIHTAWGIEEMDIWNLSEAGTSTLVWSGLAYGEAGLTLDLATDPNRFCFESEAAFNDYCFEAPMLPEGIMVNVYAVVDTSSQLFILYQFTDGSTVRLAVYRPCDEVGVSLSMSSTYISPGDKFWVTAAVCNPGDPIWGIPFVAVLDVGTDDYWFFPRWLPSSTALDYLPLDLLQGENLVPVIPEFTWPATGTEQFDRITLTAAILDKQLSTVIGDIATVRFGYGPRP